MSVTESGQHMAVRDPDARLMLRVRDGDDAAFAQLMERYQDRLVGLLYHQVGDRQLAEDLAQEVFLRVYRSRRGYVARAKFSTWLFTIANNLVSNALRSRSRSKEVPMSAGRAGDGDRRPLEHMVQVSSGQMPARQLEKAELADLVRLAVQDLNDAQRMAVLLSKFEEMSYADIAQVMGTTTMAVKSLLSRARGNLRTILEPYLHAR